MRGSGGTVSCRGHLLTGAGEAELTRFRRLQVGFVFQFYNLVPSLTARENVALVTEIARDPMAPEQALALVEKPLDIAAGIAGALDVFDHAQDSRRGTAVQRPAHCSNGSGKGSRDVGAG